MAWEDVTDTELQTGKPVKPSIPRRLRDNLVAFAQGLAGAPKIETAAIDDAAVTTAKIADGNVTSAKLASGAAGTNLAAGGLGSIGWPGLFWHNSAQAVSPGTNVSGSALDYSSAGLHRVTTSPGGTWKLAGYIQDNGVSPSDAEEVSVFVRIA